MDVDSTPTARYKDIVVSGRVMTNVSCDVTLTIFSFRCLACSEVLVMSPASCLRTSTPMDSQQRGWAPNRLTGMRSRFGYVTENAALRRIPRGLVLERDSVAYVVLSN